MRRTRMAALLLVLATPAAAQPVAPPGAAACSGCHGAGAAAVTAMSSLQGRSADEIVAAMQAFRSGERTVTVMDRIAKGFTVDETRAIAAWLGRAPREGP